MLQIKQYVKVTSLEEAYELNQKKSSVIVGGMHWLKMSSKNVGTAIDLSGLGLDQIVETEDGFEIGCMTTLRQLELHPGLNQYTSGAVCDAVKDIVGVQFRNTATVGGSIFGRYGFSDVLTVFLAMDTYVECYHAGRLALAEYVKMKADRDILVKLIVKKTQLQLAYLAQRHARTDFPILTCAVGCVDGVWRAVIGAKPTKAALITDSDGILSHESISEEMVLQFADFAAKQVVFGTNMRATEEYRSSIAPVLIKRAIHKARKGQ